MAEHEKGGALGFAGAERLTRKIARFWRKKGHPGVNVWVERTYPEARVNDPTEGTYQVRSDLINGLPR